jgi:hypothetical protein
MSFFNSQPLGGLPFSSRTISTTYSTRGLPVMIAIEISFGRFALIGKASAARQ